MKHKTINEADYYYHKLKFEGKPNMKDTRPIGTILKADPIVVSSRAHSCCWIYIFLAVGLVIASWILIA